MNKLLLPLLFSTLSTAAWAQSGDLFVSVGQSLLSSKGIGSTSATGSTNDLELDNGFRFGFRFGFNSEGRTGQEFGYAYNRSQLNFQGASVGGMAIHQGGYNYLLYATKDGARFRPFATGGVHFSNFVAPGSSASSGGGSTKFGFNYGGGVKVAVNSKWSVRFDIRQYATPKPNLENSLGVRLFLRDGWMRQLEVSGGFGIHF